MKLLVLFLGLVSLASCRYHHFGARSNGSSEHQYDKADAKLTVPELITKYGYPVEEHWVETEDGYNLTIHRIPGSPYNNGEGPKRVALLQHGLLCDSSMWILIGPERGLAYKLADEGYDVYMGNYRGNTYSKRHNKLNPKIGKFWDFSWHEHGTKVTQFSDSLIFSLVLKTNLPVIIDRVLEISGEESLYYVGHSMGTTSFFVLMSEKPEYNGKIKHMTALAPVAWTEHMVSPLRHLAPLLNSFEALISLMGRFEFLPSGPMFPLLGQTVCHEKSLIQDMCSSVMFLFAGWDTDQLDRDFLPIFLGHMPAGTSVRNILHNSQGVISGKFRQYDFGAIENLIRYKKLKPPSYDLSKVTASVAMFYGPNDWMAHAKDVAILRHSLPNVVTYEAIKHEKYNHFDFVYARDNIELLNKPVIESMNAN